MSSKSQDAPNTTVVDVANDALAGLRVSIDSNPGTPLPVTTASNGPNGLSHQNGTHQSDDLLALQEELERTRAEKDVLANQYRSLLDKLTQMRTTLGNKLKQDAVRLYTILESL